MKIRMGRDLAGEGRAKIGLAMSGGGIRGLAHIGVLKALEAHDIPIDMVAGTSAGAIVAALYACGYTPRQMEDLAKELKPRDLVDLKVTVSELFKYGLKCFLGGKTRFWAEVPNGLVKGNKIEKYFNRLWQDRTVRDTMIPLAVTAVDINTAETVFFTSPLPSQRRILNARYCYDARLTDAVRASISIPGVFYPKKYDGRALVDGAVKNNVPTDILQYMGADVILAVDLGYAGQAVKEELRSIGAILLQCIDIMNREVTLLKAEQYAHVIIRPVLNDIQFRSGGQALSAIGRGEAAAGAKIAAIQRLLW